MVNNVKADVREVVSNVNPDVGEVVGDMKADIGEVVSDVKADVRIALLGHHTQHLNDQNATCEINIIISTDKLTLRS